MPVASPSMLHARSVPDKGKPSPRRTGGVFHSREHEPHHGPLPGVLSAVICRRGPRPGSWRWPARARPRPSRPTSRTGRTRAGRSRASIPGPVSDTATATPAGPGRPRPRPTRPAGVPDGVGEEVGQDLADPDRVDVDLGDGAAARQASPTPARSALARNAAVVSWARASGSTRSRWSRSTRPRPSTGSGGRRAAGPSPPSPRGPAPGASRRPGRPRPASPRRCPGSPTAGSAARGRRRPAGRGAGSRWPGGARSSG